MAENTQSGRGFRQGTDKESLRTHMTPDGRYIPYSGGLMGWFENSGVLRSERRNGYKFYTMMDAESLRHKLVARWSDGEKVNRRIAARQNVDGRKEVTVAQGPDRVQAATKDFSTHGLRLQIGEALAGLEKGAAVQIGIAANSGASPESLAVGGEVVWVRSAGAKRAVWTFGVAFEEIPHETREQLHEFFLSR